MAGKSKTAKKAEKDEQLQESSVFMTDNISSMSRGLFEPKSVSYSEKLSSMLHGRTIYCVTHKTDMDGVASAAMMHKFYGVPTERMKFMEYSLASYNEIVEWLTGKDISNSALLFSDVGFNPDAFPLLRPALMMLKQKGNLVVWLDHHPWSPEQITFCSENLSYMVVGENRLMCGTDLVYNILCKGEDKDGSGMKLAELAHTMDFNLRSKSTDQLTFRLARAITYMLWDKQNTESYLRKLVPVIAEMDFGNRLIVNSERKYLEEEKANIVELLSGAKTFMAAGHSITVGFGKRLQSNAACEALMSKEGSDIAAFVNYSEGRCAMRSKSGVDCSYIAKAMGGNGHPQAAGFPAIPSEYSGFDAKGRAKFIKTLMRAADNAGSAGK